MTRINSILCKNKEKIGHEYVCNHNKKCCSSNCKTFIKINAL